MKRTMLITMIGIMSLMTGCIAKPNISSYEMSTEEKTAEEVVEEEIVSTDITETSEESEPVKEEVSIDLDELERLRVRNRYCSALTDFLLGGALPDGYFDSSDYDENMPDIDEDYDWQEGNEYAFADVNGDDQEELLLSLKHNYTAGQIGYIYSYDSVAKTMINEMTTYPVFDEVYSNGVIKMGISHNQGMAGDALWPYDLWVYDSKQKVFDVIASVDAWDGNVFPTDYSDTPFPSELDENGDGVLYTHEWDEGNHSYKWIDNAEYEEWLNTYIANADLVPIEWKEIGKQEWNDDVQKLNELIIDYNEKAGNFGDNDIGYSFIKNVDKIALMERAENIINKTSDTLGLELVKTEEGMTEIRAYSNGTEVLYSNYDTMYALNYVNEQIGDLTILGIYPGMSYDEASKHLENMYFYTDNESCDNEDGSTTVSFKTGEDVGNYIIYLDQKDGIIKRVSINEIFSF